jgi:muconate cycloisomerase
VGKQISDIASILHDVSERLAGSLYVQAAVGDALYDAFARTLACPVYALLGGSCRSEVEVGLAIGIAGDPAAMIDAAQSVYERGYRHIRVKIGLDAETDLACCTALRRHFGDKVVLRADANGGMNYGDALRLLRRLEALDLDIVEQPLPGWDLAGMASLARAVRIPLSADESLTDDHSLMAIAQLGAASVMQTKSAKNGGIDGTRRLWQMARAAGIGIFPGNHPSTGLNVAAVAHLAAATPYRLLVGDFQTGCVDMIAEDVLSEPIVVVDGKLRVPRGAGFGVDLDPEKVAKYRVDTH